MKVKYLFSKEDLEIAKLSEGLGVYIDDTHIIAASNFAIIMRALEKEYATENFPDVPGEGKAILDYKDCLYLRAEAVEDAASVPFKKKQDIPEQNYACIMAGGQDHVAFVGWDGNTMRKVKAEMLEGAPNFKAMFNKFDPTDDYKSVFVDPDALIKILRHFKKSGPVQLRVRGEDKGLELLSGSQRVRGIIMPMSL